MEWVSAHIRALRTALRLAQEDFADRLGAAPKTVRNWERGKHSPGLALQRAMDEILEGASPGQKERFFASLNQDQKAPDQRIVDRYGAGTGEATQISSRLRSAVVSRGERLERWPMDGRYARAREAGGLVFGADMQGRQVVKRVTGVGWTVVPDSIAALLRVELGARVWARARETLVEGEITGISVRRFPAEVAEGTIVTTPGSFPPGGVVRALEDAGYRISRTYNEVRARLANSKELEVFGPDPDLAPLHERNVLEVRHATYSSCGEPLEAVVSVRPADKNVVVFRTSEGDLDETDRKPSFA